MIHFINFSIFSFRTYHRIKPDITENLVELDDFWLENFSLSTPKGFHLEWIYSLSMAIQVREISLSNDWHVIRRKNIEPKSSGIITNSSHCALSNWMENPVHFNRHPSRTTDPKCYWFTTEPSSNLIFYALVGIWAIRAMNGIKDGTKLDLNAYYGVLYSIKLRKYILLRISMFCGNNCKPCATSNRQKRTSESSQRRTKSIFFGNKNNTYAKIKATRSISPAL